MNQDQTYDRDLASLMRAAQEGDAAAYVRLLRDIASRLRRIVRNQRSFSRRRNIEDGAGHPFVPARRSPHIRSATAVHAWLLAIVRNRLADTACHYLLDWRSVIGRTRTAAQLP